MGSVILEVAIGLVLLFLLLSIACSAIQEWIATRLAWRGRLLREALHSLLEATRDGEPNTLRRFLSHPIILDLAAKPERHARAWAEMIQGSGPVVRWLWRMRYLFVFPAVNRCADWADRRFITGTGTLDAAAPLTATVRPGEGCKPSYIPAELFATVLLDIVVPADSRVGPHTFQRVRTAVAALPERSDLRTTLLALVDNADSDIAKVRLSIEGWYNDSMDRLSGWYKRYINFWLRIIAFTLAVVLNADAIMIARVLMIDDKARTALVDAAVANLDHLRELSEPRAEAGAAPLTEKQRQERVELLESELRTVHALLRETAFPVGWSTTPGDVRAWPGVAPWSPGSAFSWAALAQVLVKLLGFLITTTAVSFGAPFWFDLLNKLINLRGTGPKPK